MLDELVQELARLYGDVQSARRVAADAGIPEQFVEFDGPAIDAWRRIVDQASKRGILANLLRVVVKEYGNNSKLQRMYGAYLYETPSNESQIAVGLPRNDADALSRLERSLDRLNQIINGTEWNKGEDGVLAGIRQIKAEMVVVSNDVHEIKRMWNFVKWSVIVLLPFVTIIGITLLLALSGVWGRVG